MAGGAEVSVERLSQRSLRRELKAFLNAKLINIFALGLFLLLAVFLLYPILAVLVKSFYGEDGFTLDNYKEFFKYRFYYWSFLNTLILGFTTMIALLVVGFCFAYMTTRGPSMDQKALKVGRTASPDCSTLYFCHLPDHPFWT